MSRLDNRVTVKLFATLRDFLPPEAEGGAFTRAVAPGAVIEDLVEALELPKDVKLIVLVNALHAVPGQALHDGDVVAIFPPIAGG